MAVGALTYVSAFFYYTDPVAFGVKTTYLSLDYTYWSHHHLELRLTHVYASFYVIDPVAFE